MEAKRKIRLNTMQIIAIGFVVIILIGALLLSLPAASKDNTRIPFINALFTATSALCVTGLATYDTYTQFTLFGQIVILVLIQTGGLGFMSVAGMIFLMLGKKIGLRERGLLMETMNTPHIGGVVKLLRRIIITSFAIEMIAAALLSIRFIPLLGTVKGIYYGIFHAISAFCNAGFDLMGVFDSRSSLIGFEADVLVNVVAILLMLIGGLGFIVWDDIMDNKLKFSKYRLHTKIVLIGTAVLVVFPAIFFFFLESNNTLAGMTFGEKVLASVFQVVSPRTAGFNTVEISELSEGSLLLTILLMIIGANPGSTGGGIKITTVFVIILTIKAYITHEPDLNVGGKRLEDFIPRKAFSIASIYVILASLACFFIVSIQPFTLEDTMFETVSAISTVGLTTGITPELNILSKIAVIILMYCGRVGSLTVIAALAGDKPRPNIRQMEERIIIG
ncbi:MAG TPA: TrkH family potassium uptake protein [Clostridia bacterium]|jgi:trk system potassium uptake protein TrkH|nr:Trk family potassium uptake protein [Clostridiaceae bacterium]HOF26853.1 TrkH family potassium uptake protein [Clostridia bacterium]HOM34965.1 TrkH family potassium uptake protein [Clostridia bacterium]HOR90136.1 TrkH family potassium uptake protein [Clostridia bacterium]HOT70398.1 TrkH family potassium uptake protein [Clostridia bacterium]